MPTAVQNLLISIGISYEAQLAAARNLFFAAAVDKDDPTRPLFGGEAAKNGEAIDALAKNDGTYVSTQNIIDGSPLTVLSTSTASGQDYKIVDEFGNVIKTFNSGAATVRYRVDKEGNVLDGLLRDTAGAWQENIGGPDNPVTAWDDAEERMVGRITFKPFEGAALASRQDELGRIGAVVNLLTQLLESIREGDKGAVNLIR